MTQSGSNNEVCVGIAISEKQMVLAFSRCKSKQFSLTTKRCDVFFILSPQIVSRFPKFLSFYASIGGK